MAFTVTYNGNGNDGGSAPSDPQSPYSTGATVAVAVPASMTRSGATFAYWSTNADGTGVIHGWPADTTFTMPASDLVLFAQWFVTTGLTNGGKTGPYAFAYDGSLRASGLEPSRTNQLIAAAAADFAVMSGWFAGVTLSGPIAVYVTRLTGGANNTGDIRLKPNSNAVGELRSYLISEITESFMNSQNKGWGFLRGVNNEESCGEGLSLFLTQQFQLLQGITGPYTENTANGWLNSSLPPSDPLSTRSITNPDGTTTDFGSRADYVNSVLPFPGNGPATGCSILFIYYLFHQFGSTIPEIIAAAPGFTDGVLNSSAPLRGVYQNLTGDHGDPFPAFAHQLDVHYPTGVTIQGSAPDNPYPIGKNIVWHNRATNETQIWFMNAERVARRGTVLGEDGAPAFVGPPWFLVATGDVGGGRGAQLLWHNRTSHEAQIWFLDGERVVRRGTVLGETGAPALVGPPWRIVATGDLDGNGTPDILWHNSATNETQIWFMNAERVARRGTVLGEDATVAFVGPPWHIVGTTRSARDRVSGIVWHNSATGETQIWFMNAEHVLGRETVVDEAGAAALIGPPWSIVSTTDASAERQWQLAWHNSATNETQIWFMDAERLVRRRTVLGQDGTVAFVGPPWRITGTEDTQTHIVWHNNTTNETQIWFLDDSRVVRRGTVLGEDGAAAFVGPPWRIVATSNADGDGLLQIVWHNSATNETQIWFMNDALVMGRGTVLDESGAPAFVGPPWTIVGAGDLDGNGRPDLVWHNSATNETQIWFMNGEHVARRGTVLGETGAPALVGPPWTIAGVGDLTGNGTSDLVWHNSATNETQIWFMNGEHVARRGTVLDETGAPALVGPPWRIVTTGDVAADGQPEIVWHNSATNETQIWFMNAEHVARRGTVLGETGAPALVGPPWTITP